jgi:hypothetical protein
MPFRIPRASISRQAQVSSATFSTGAELVCIGNSRAPFDIPGGGERLVLLPRAGQERVRGAFSALGPAPVSWRYLAGAE